MKGGKTLASKKYTTLKVSEELRDRIKIQSALERREMIEFVDVELTRVLDKKGTPKIEEVEK